MTLIGIGWSVIAGGATAVRGSGSGGSTEGMWIVAVMILVPSLLMALAILWATRGER